jgi:hypothetical protein
MQSEVLDGEKTRRFAGEFERRPRFLALFCGLAPTALR